MIYILDQQIGSSKPEYRMPMSLKECSSVGNCSNNQLNVWWKTLTVDGYTTHKGTQTVTLEPPVKPAFALIQYLVQEIALSIEYIKGIGGDTLWSYLIDNICLRLWLV